MQPAFSKYFATADENLSASQAVYLSDTDTIKLAKADAAATANLIGFVDQGTNIGVQTVVLTNDSLGGFTNLTPGSVYYLSQSTAGAITSTKPSSGIVMKAGIAKSTTELDIHIENQTIDSHQHTASEISDFDTEVDGNASVTANTAKNSYPTADETKLAGIDDAAKDDQTGAEIKTAYETENDTNAFTDTEKTKLTGIAVNATENDTDANLKNRDNHTGTQVAATISDFDTEVDDNTSVAANTAKVGVTTEEANPDVVPQAEAEAGIATTERIWTSQRVKQSIDALAPGGGSGKNDINFSYGTTAGDFVEIAATSIYTMLDSFIFQGSIKLGTPTYIKALMSSTGGDDYQWRIYDVTNSLVIAEGSISAHQTRQIIDFGAIDNVPTAIATWELQVKEVPTSSAKARCHCLLIGF